MGLRRGNEINLDTSWFRDWRYNSFIGDAIDNHQAPEASAISSRMTQAVNDIERQQEGAVESVDDIESPIDVSLLDAIDVNADTLLYTNRGISNGYSYGA